MTFPRYSVDRIVSHCRIVLRTEHERHCNRYTATFHGLISFLSPLSGPRPLCMLFSGPKCLQPWSMVQNSTGAKSSNAIESIECLIQCEHHQPPPTTVILDSFLPLHPPPSSPPPDTLTQGNFRTSPQSGKGAVFVRISSNIFFFKLELTREVERWRATKQNWS